MRGHDFNGAVEMVYKGIFEINRMFEDKDANIGPIKYQELFFGMKSLTIPYTAIGIFLTLLADFSITEN